MRRRPEFRPFDERLNGEKVRIEAALENARPGFERDVLERKLRQIETALRIDCWVSSKELQSPKPTLD